MEDSIESMATDITTFDGTEQVRGLACMMIQSSKSIYGRSNFSIGLLCSQRNIPKPDVTKI